MRAHEYAVVLVTAPAAEAQRLARWVIERELAACVNLVSGVCSVYRWEGRICEEPEVLLVIKTRAALVAMLCEQLVETHPYDLPEVIALPIVGGHAPYLQWLGAATEASVGRP
ncbi:MAG: divalent-cation tolerance protein CutA [Proteobacteria bacterium]|nr:divalent-cation tolerance protein CutA [Pseudomonadota bacterium]